MAKARQQYYADETTLQKESREFAIEPEIVTKIDSIETGAQVNVIETVKVNGEALEPDSEKAVDISVPLVDDTLYSTSSEDALSARQGRILYDYIQNVQSRGRFLSNWNCSTGLAMTNPSDNPYLYRTGDYYLVSNVSSGTNYRPDGSQYVIGQASQTVESETVKVSDMYVYDGTNWLLLINTERQIAIDSSLSTTSTNPVENRVVTNAINTKQDNLIAGANIQIAADGKTISATDTTYSSLPAAEGGADVSLVTTGDKYTWNGKQDKLIAGNNVSIAADGKTISAVDTTYSAGTNIQISAQNVISSTDESAIWGNISGTLSNQTDLQTALNTKQDNLTAGANITIDANNEISAVDTTYTAGANVTIDANNEISAVDTTYTASDFDIKDLADTTNLRTTWSGKQDALTAGNNIQINGTTISATDTTYTASDFDIKDLSDTTGLRTTWSGKQDALTAGANITIDQNNEISATDTTYTAGANVSISNNNVISATDSKAEWGNISGTLSDQTDLGTALSGKQDNLIAGTNIQIAADGKTISATDTTYTAGTGISIDSNNVISNTQTSAEWGNITGTLSDQTDLNTALGGKQATLAAGSNIQIAADGYTISATDTTYTAGTGISIDSNNVISNTQTSAEWGNITGTLADQTDLKTELDKKMENLVFLSYGTSTWGDFEAAYGKNVYCRASSNSNPAQGDQTRCAFMAYINNPNISSATEVEFQYYRSVATHSDSTQGDEVFVYKLNKTTGRSVTKRNAYTKIAAGTNMSSSYSNGTLTLSATDTTYNTATSSTAGLVKLGSDTTQTESAQSASSTAGRTYPVQLNSSDQMVVNVPWEDTQTGSATSTAAGTVKLFSDTQQTETAQSVSSTANRTYGIQNNSSNQMVVNVPWTDTTYSNGTYLTLNGTTFDVDTSLIATKTDLANFAGFQVVATLPTSDIKTNIIYLLGPFTSTTGSDKYEEWIYSNSNWIMIGETSVDLSPYFNYTTQTSDAITEGSTNLFLTSAERTLLGNTSGTNSGDETKTTIQTKLGAATSSNSGYLTSTDWSTFNSKADTTIINDTAYAASWDADTTHAPTKNAVYDKISAMDTTISGKQDALSIQTAYTTKGTSTKVPTITTNTLGQVTTITETNIDFPVTSVNGSTGDITGLQTTSNLKTSLTDNSDSYYPSQKAVKTAVDAKQDALSTQTAYTSKGTASKVPQITTNSLGQVTGITEVNITYPSQVDDTAYASSWNGVTGTAPSKNAVYDKISAMDTTISGKQDALSTQTAYTSKGSATKVPQITTNTLGQVTGITEVTITHPSQVSDTAYANTWDGVTDTAPSKNAVYDKISAMDTTIAGKQAALATQTAYTAKGTSTKVPQITTNTLGQVTGITEVNISFPAQNTKTFYLSSTSDLTTGQEIYDFIAADGYPIIVYGDLTYVIAEAAYNYIRFVGAEITASTRTSDSYAAQPGLGLSISSGTVVDIQVLAGWTGGYFLRTDINYSTPYTPLYNGSPATKKYVDDIKPTSGSAAPSTTPTFVGQQYVDTTNDKMYVATGTSSSSDWMEVGAGSGDMLYSDYNWVAKTGATVTLDLASTITPSANFTVNAPSTIKDGQSYILRVNNGNTAYTMTLGTNVTNPYNTSTTLTAGGVDQFVFLAIGGNLELQPEGGSSGAISNDTTGTTTTVSKVWAGTETEYNNLSSYDSSTIYYVF